MTFCKKIEPFVVYYKRLIKSYNHMAHSILENEINLILPQVLRKQKCGIITMLVSSFIGLAYEGISSFLHHKRNKALHMVVRAMDNKSTILLCNPKFVCKNNPYFGLSSTYFLYPLTSLPKMVKQEMPASIEQS